MLELYIDGVMSQVVQEMYKEEKSGIRIATINPGERKLNVFDIEGGYRSMTDVIGGSLQCIYNNACIAAYITTDRLPILEPNRICDLICIDSGISIRGGATGVVMFVKHLPSTEIVSLEQEHIVFIREYVHVLIDANDLARRVQDF
jgi:hypothetical protein